MLRRRTIPREDAEKTLRIFEEWTAGRKAREGVETHVEQITFFMRHYGILWEVERHLKTIAGNRGGLSALDVGPGVYSVLPLTDLKDNRIPQHLRAPMVWEPLEIASMLERIKRGRHERPGGFDWDVEVIEANRVAADVLRSQKLVTIMPIMGEDVGREEATVYARNFLPGARRVPVDAGVYNVTVESHLDAFRRYRGASPMLDAMEVVHVPKYYRGRIHVENVPVERYVPQPQSKDFILCYMGSQDYLIAGHRVVSTLLEGLRPGGLLVTDQSVSLEDLDLQDRFRRFEWSRFGDTMRKAHCYIRV